MPVFVDQYHIQLIDDLLSIEDIKGELLHQIDIEEIIMFYSLYQLFFISDIFKYIFL